MVNKMQENYFRRQQQRQNNHKKIMIKIILLHNNDNKFWSNMGWKHKSTATIFTSYPGVWEVTDIRKV